MRSMKIMVPLNNIDYIDRFIAAGADEFYLGFYDKAWEEQFGENADINRMSSFKTHANSNSFYSVLNIVDYVKSMGKSIFITLNANTYSANQLEKIRFYYSLLIDHKADGVIVSTISSAQLAIDVGIRAVASTMCSIYNSDIAKFYHNIGVDRMILPRDLTLSEIGELISNVPDVEYEAFFMRNGCRFSDSYCLGRHSIKYGAVCGQLKKTKCKICSRTATFDSIENMSFNKYVYDKAFHNEACGQCSLYALHSLGVKSLKIVGRADNPEQVLDDIVLTSKNITIMENSRTEKDYLENMIMPDEDNLLCLRGMNCYYPETRFK